MSDVTLSRSLALRIRFNAHILCAHVVRGAAANPGMLYFRNA